MKLRIFIISLLLIMILMPLVSAENTAFATFQQGEDIELIIPCVDSGESPCASTVQCNISITSPNGSLIIENDLMTFKSLGNFNYTIGGNISRDLGIYIANRPCTNGSESGFTRLAYRVTPTGSEKPTNGESLIIFISTLVMLSFGIFFFVLGLRVNSGIGTLAFLLIGGLIIFITILFSLNMVVDNLSHLGSAVEGYSTFLTVAKTIVSITMTILVLYALVNSLKLWGLRRGLRVE